MFVALKLWFSTPAARWIHLGAKSRKTPTQCQNSSLTQINQKAGTQILLVIRCLITRWLIPTCGSENHRPLAQETVCT